MVSTGQKDRNTRYNPVPPLQNTNGTSSSIYAATTKLPWARLCSAQLPKLTKHLLEKVATELKQKTTFMHTTQGQRQPRLSRFASLGNSLGANGGAPGGADGSALPPADPFSPDSSPFYLSPPSSRCRELRAPVM